MNVAPSAGALVERRPPKRLNLVAPRPNWFGYEWNRWTGFLRSPRRFFNYIKYLIAKRIPTVNYLPIKIDVENVSRCNLKCTMCQVSDWPKQQRAEDMTLEQFKHVIDSQYGIFEMKLQGYGEATLQRDTFFDMIKYARKRRIWVRASTNGTLLHLNDNYKKIIDADANDIQVSIDGATKETYEKIRRGALFERVVDNCRLMNDHCLQKGVLKTRMWVVLQQDNIHEFLAFIDIAAKMGFRRMTYSVNMHGFGQEKWETINGETDAGDSITRELAEEAINRGKARGIEVSFWALGAKYSSSTPASMCAWPFERVFISSDMRVVPCCLIANPETADFGDAKDFNKAWFGEVFQEFRRAHIEGRVPRYCESCYEKNSTSPGTSATSETRLVSIQTRTKPSIVTEDTSPDRKAS